MIATYPAKGYNINHFPAVKEYLLSFGRSRLNQTGDKGARKKTTHQWYETQDSIGYWKEMQKTKIIWPNLQNSNKFSYDDGCHTVCAPSVILPTDDLALLGILNSKVVWKFLTSVCVVRSGGYIEAKPQYCEQIPIPEIDSSNPDDVRRHDELVRSVEKRLALNKRLHEGDGGAANPRQGEMLERQRSSLDRHIDELVYDLYALTETERSLIENA